MPTLPVHDLPSQLQFTYQSARASACPPPKTARTSNMECSCVSPLWPCMVASAPTPLPARSCRPSGTRADAAVDGVAVTHDAASLLGSARLLCKGCHYGLHRGHLCTCIVHAARIEAPRLPPTTLRALLSRPPPQLYVCHTCLAPGRSVSSTYVQVCGARCREGSTGRIRGTHCRGRSRPAAAMLPMASSGPFEAAAHAGRCSRPRLHAEPMPGGRQPHPCAPSLHATAHDRWRARGPG
jgi:hypothetical protein